MSGRKKTVAPLVQMGKELILAPVLTEEVDRAFGVLGPLVGAGGKVDLRRITPGTEYVVRALYGGSSALPVVMDELGVTRARLVVEYSMIAFARDGFALTVDCAICEMIRWALYGRATARARLEIDHACEIARVTNPRYVARIKLERLDVKTPEGPTRRSKMRPAAIAKLEEQSRAGMQVSTGQKLLALQKLSEMRGLIGPPDGRERNRTTKGILVTMTGGGSVAITETESQNRSTSEHPGNRSSLRENGPDRDITPEVQETSDPSGRSD